MGVYIGGNKVIIHKDRQACRCLLPSVPPYTNGIKLMSLEKYILKDSNGHYLTAKEAK